MTIGDILNIAVLLYGIALIIFTAVKPKFFWEQRHMVRRRKLVGDDATVRMYYVIGVVMVIVGFLGMIGVIG